MCGLSQVTTAHLQNLWTAQIIMQTWKFMSVLQNEVKSIAKELHLHVENNNVSTHTTDYSDACCVPVENTFSQS